MTVPRCPAGHELASGRRRVCPRCRRQAVIDAAAASETSLPRAEIAAAVDAVATNPAVLRNLAAALLADPTALPGGAPPVVGRLVAELLARGSTSLAAPACVVCARTGRPLSVTSSGGMCPRCAARRDPRRCAHCGEVKPVAGRTDQGAPVCERCRRWHRGRRRCGLCGNTAPIALRARDGRPQVCVNCYHLPEAVCAVCRRRRPCAHAASDTPLCRACCPRATAICTHCGADRPPTARADDGPVCDACYTAALRRRGHCAVCGALRRLVAPPGPAASTCADCAGVPVTHACRDCGTEDKLYEKDRCAPCSLRRRTSQLLGGQAGQVPGEFQAVFAAICSARVPRTALNWLRNGAGAALLADLAAGRLEATHAALDEHPRRQAADYLRQVLVAGGVLVARDEELARTQRWLSALLDGIATGEDRRLVQAFATWRVMRRLRRSAEAHQRPRTYTAHARVRVKAAAEFLAWLAAHDTTLAQARQADIDAWLLTGPGAWTARDFLDWAAERGHCRAFHIPTPERRAGPATDPEQRWAVLDRLLHDQELDLTDRVAGCLLLLFGQQQSRIAAMTTDQVTAHDDEVFVRFGSHELPVPDTLGQLLLQLARDGKPHIGVGSPRASRWLFPGGLPGRPITAARLAERLQALGISTQTGRRAALIDLAAQLPAAVLADLLGLHPTTAVRWMHQAGGDWNRYAAELTRTP